MVTNKKLPASSAVRRTLMLVAATGLLIAPLVILFDISIASALRGIDLPSDLRKGITLGEVFGHGTSVGLILVAVLAIDPQGLKQLPRLAALAYGSGLIANAFKVIVARLRPEQIADFTGSGFSTFLGFRPLIDLPLAPGQSESMYQSFPSGHAATAVGLAIGLSLAYPRGRWFFAVLACLTVAQRIVDEYHFLSDTLVGASLAFAWCGFLLPWLEWRAVSRPVFNLRSYSPSKAV